MSYTEINNSLIRNVYISKLKEVDKVIEGVTKYCLEIELLNGSTHELIYNTQQDRQNAINDIGASKGTDDNAVHYSADTGKTDEQKQQARSNIGITSVLPTVTESDNGKVLKVANGAWSAVTAGGNEPLIVGYADDEMETATHSSTEIFEASSAGRPVFFIVEDAAVYPLTLCSPTASMFSLVSFNGTTGTIVETTISGDKTVTTERVTFTVTPNT